MIKVRFFNKQAQTIIELSIFAGVFIFIVGLIARQTLSYNYQQDLYFKAFRLAQRSSYEQSFAYKGQGGFEGNKSRDSATVLFIEDRLTASNNKYGPIDRTPEVANASAIFSRNLFMPVDGGESWNLPVMDVYINGKHFPFTTAAIKQGGPSGTVYKIVVNVDSDFDPTCDACFDLDRDGTVDITDPNVRQSFLWQWQAVSASDVDVDSGANVQVDLDNDLKEERILAGGYYLDYQEGDLDMTIDQNDVNVNGRFWPGLQDDYEIDTKTVDQSGRSTFLRLTETDFNNGNIIKSISKKNSEDIITRKFQLSNNAGRFCRYDSSGNPIRPATVDGLRNPVEVCVVSISGCYAGGNRDKTCLAMNASTTGKDPLLLIRSRIIDRHGRKWVTSKDKDHYESFSTQRSP